MNREEVITALQNGRRDFRHVDFSGEDLSMLDLSGCDFRHAKFEDTDLQHCYLKHSRWTSTGVIQAMQSGQKSFRFITLVDDDLTELANMPLAWIIDLQGIQCRNVDLSGLNFRGMDLRFSRFIDCKCQDVDFRDTKLAGTHIYGMDTHRALFNSPSFIEAVAAGCDNFEGANLEEVDAEILKAHNISRLNLMDTRVAAEALELFL